MTPWHAVLVLTCRGRNRWAAMTAVAAATYRRANPGARVTLVTDPPSRDALDDAPDVLAHFDEVVAVPTDFPDPIVASRELKTRVRDAVDGDYLVLDADTVSVRPVGALPPGAWDVAAAADRDRRHPVVAVFPHWREPDFRRLGWDYPLPRFFNAGVVFYRDTPAARALYPEWRRRWKQAAEAGMADDDQLPLNSAIFATPGLVPVELDPRYNAVVRVHPAHARGAKILHFYSGALADHPDPSSIHARLTDHYLAAGEVDWAALDRCAALDHPWVEPHWPRQLWQTGNRWRAVRTAAGQRFGRLLGRGGRP